MTFRVIPMSSGEFDVQVDGVRGVRNHRVAVGPDLLADLAVDGTEGQRVVSAAIDHIDDRRELAALPPYVDLSDFRERDGFMRDVRRRLAS